MASIINRLMWDPKRLFYYDLTLEGKRAPIKTVAAFWTLLAKVASPAQARALVDELHNPATFGRLNRIPTLAADQPGYDPAGGYWRRAVWAPTDTMVIRGLENYGYSDLARENALQHLDLVSQVYKKTGTIGENYAPDTFQQGKPARGDFGGWSGIGPSMYLLEYAIGLKPNAQRNELRWELVSGGRRGCERFCFNSHIVSLLATAEIGDPHRIRITVDSDGDFSLRAVSKGSQKTFSVAKGKPGRVLIEGVSGQVLAPKLVGRGT